MAINSENLTAPVDVLIMTSTNPASLPSLCRFVESKGFKELWLAEDYFFLGGFSSVAIALEATQDIKVGLGIAASVVRHPAVTAMEIATLAGAYPGRFIPGIGHGAPVWTKQMGVFPKSILATLRETITSIRSLLAGETLTIHDGHFYFDNVALAHPVDGVKILAGVSGPKSLELAGEIADGTVLGALSSPEYIKSALQFIDCGVQKTSLEGPHTLPTIALFAVDKDRSVARAAVRGVLAFYLNEVGPTGLTAPAGINDDLADMRSRGGMETIAEEMPEDWIDKLAIAGDQEDCVEGIKTLLAAGASSVICAPVMADQLEGQIEIIAEEIIPNI